LPPTLVNAILSAEDKRFLRASWTRLHSIFGAAWNDLRHGNALARRQHHHHASCAEPSSSPTDRNWRRKIVKPAVVPNLEQRFNKKPDFRDVRQ